MSEVFTYETPTATVRIHPGKMSGEEFRTTIEAAARKFYSDIKKSDSKKEIKKYERC
jgi:hypothetical protein